MGAVVVSREIATTEVYKWLDFKKINEKKRDAQKDQIESLIDALVDGSLILNPDFTFTQTLKFPTEGELKIITLDYKPRLKMQAIHAAMGGVKSGDVDGRVLAYIAALTSTTKAIIKDLDTEDYSISQSIAIFFL